jgi:hypothetical protein
METSGLQRRFGFAIRKIDDARREIWGIATSEALDTQNEIVDYEASKKAFTEWSQLFSKNSNGETLGNLRSMHQLNPVGKILSVKFDDENRQVWVGARLSKSPEGEAAWNDVQDRVLNGFSIGAPQCAKRPDYYKGKLVNRVFDYILGELSLVDNPACPDAFIKEFKLASAAGEVLCKNALDLMPEDAEPCGKDFQGLEANAFVDGAGRVWLMNKGIIVEKKTSEGMKMSKKTATTAVTEGSDQGSNKVQIHQIADTAPPGPEIPKVKEGPKGDGVGGVVPLGSPAGKNLSGGTEVKVPDGQGGASKAPTKAAAAADVPLATGPSDPPHVDTYPHDESLEPQPSAAPANKYAFCAVCGTKLAEAEAGVPYHAACAAKEGVSKGLVEPPLHPPVQPPPPPPPAKTEELEACSTPKDAEASGGQAVSMSLKTVQAEGLMKAKFDKLTTTIETLTKANGELAARLDKIEKTPIPGGPARTELPQGVMLVDKAAGAGFSDAGAAVAALEKIATETKDPFTRDLVQRELAKCAYLGGIAKRNA